MLPIARRSRTLRSNFYAASYRAGLKWGQQPRIQKSALQMLYPLGQCREFSTVGDGPDTHYDFKPINKAPSDIPSHQLVDKRAGVQMMRVICSEEIASNYCNADVFCKENVFEEGLANPCGWNYCHTNMENDRKGCLVGSSTCLDNKLANVSSKSLDFMPRFIDRGLWIAGMTTPVYVMPILNRGFCSEAAAVPTPDTPESRWQSLFAEPSKWHDLRKVKKQLKAPDFKNKDTGKILRSSDSSTPDWVIPKLSGLGSEVFASLTENAWENLFADPSKWFDNRSSKLGDKLPDFVNRETGEALWARNEKNPAWVPNKLKDLPNSAFAPAKIEKIKKKNRKPSKLIYMKHNYNSYLMKVQAVRQLGLHYILNKEMKNHFHKRTNMYSLLNLETRLDIILLRIHFCSTIPQARQMVSHQKIRVNNEIVRARLRLSCGDFIEPAGQYYHQTAEVMRRNVWKAIGGLKRVTRKVWN